jgi:carbon-monoxide dehydrogenase small subunit
MSGRETSITMTVNGAVRAVTTPPSMTLLDLIRYRLELTGSKECCSEGECGACTVILDGEPVNSCLVLAVEADGSRVMTVEGLGDGALSPLQESFLTSGAVQCGFCIPGMVMAATALLEREPHPTEAEIREGLSGNLCRCGGYTRICAAVLAASTAGAAGV